MNYALKRFTKELRDVIRRGNIEPAEKILVLQMIIDEQKDIFLSDNEYELGVSEDEEENDDD